MSREGQHSVCLELVDIEVVLQWWDCESDVWDERDRKNEPRKM